MALDRSRGSAWWLKRWGGRLAAARADELASGTLSAAAAAFGADLRRPLVPAYPPGGLAWEDAVLEAGWRLERTRFPMVPAGDPAAYAGPANSRPSEQAAMRRRGPAAA